MCVGRPRPDSVFLRGPSCPSWLMPLLCTRNDSVLNVVRHRPETPPPLRPAASWLQWPSLARLFLNTQWALPAWAADYIAADRPARRTSREFRQHSYLTHRRTPRHSSRDLLIARLC